MKILKSILQPFNVLNYIIVVLLLLLPYWLFEGKLFIGGDDTRLLYSYPIEYFQNATIFSWYNVSTIGINATSHYLAPFMFLWSGLYLLIQDRVVVSYFAFSLPLILGFIFMQQLVNELFDLKNEHGIETLIGSLFYIFSPILMVNQLFIFLTAAWLIGLFPMITYVFIRYLKSGRFLFIYVGAILCLIFSVGSYSVPWILGLVLPIICGLVIIAFISNKKEIYNFIKKTIFFFGFIFITQAFWLTNFIAAYLFADSNSFAQKFVSKGFVDTFTPTILSTATGNILYPLLNLFHRQIPFDFGWALKDTFINFYDTFFIVNVFILFILAFGIFNYKKELKEIEKERLYLFFLGTFLISLYFFTVNIGPLKDIFLMAGKIPVFLMFRNFYDKFAPGYVFIYSILITISLIIISKKFFTRKYLIITPFLIVIIINALSIKMVVNAPMWGTENIYRVITIPKEYTETMNYLKNNISSTNTVLSLPFGTAVYTVIKDVDTNNVYVGVSPVKIFSGVNDISGHYSFNFSEEANIIDGLIINSEHERFKEILHAHNINFVLLTKNIPKEVMNTWVFDERMIEKQDSNFLSYLVDKKVYESSQGGYEIYSIKDRKTLLESQNLSFKKINPSKYEMRIKNLSGPQSLTFLDSFHGDWKIYVNDQNTPFKCKIIYTSSKMNTSECKEDFRFFEMSDLFYLFKKPLFDEMHTTNDGISNEWVIDPNIVKNTMDSSKYTENEDEGIDITFTLYFKPQAYFYAGIIISALAFAGGLIYLIYMGRKNR